MVLTRRQDAQGNWSMTGDLEFRVTASSATHCRPWENTDDYLYPMDRDHSDLVKFRAADVDYDTVWETIQGMVEQSKGFQERRTRY